MLDLIEMEIWRAEVRKPIVCVDFDGVIHSYKQGWRGASVIPDEPVPGAIDGLLGLLEGGYNVAIYSSRSKNPLGRWAMKRWLGRAIGEHWKNSGSRKIYDAEVECYGDATGIYRKFSWPWFKPPAVMTIDDRAICFDGDWSKITPQTIKEFKPWNKR